MRTPFRIFICGLMAVCLCAVVLAQTDALKNHVAAIKESLANNKQNLRHYQWTETVVVLLNGEEKSRKVYQDHYGPDGTVQKTEVTASPEKRPGGLRGHVMEKK